MDHKHLEFLHKCFRWELKPLLYLISNEKNCDLQTLGLKVVALRQKSHPNFTAVLESFTALKPEDSFATRSAICVALQRFIRAFNKQESTQAFNFKKEQANSKCSVIYFLVRKCLYIYLQMFHLTVLEAKEKQFKKMFEEKVKKVKEEKGNLSSEMLLVEEAFALQDVVGVQLLTTFLFFASISLQLPLFHLFFFSVPPFTFSRSFRCCHFFSRCFSSYSYFSNTHYCYQGCT